jgi:PhzF family phenazine biosynthesis protein
MRIPLFHVNAFADRLFSGNPAAVCLLDSWLDDGRLRKVAAESNLSATAYVVSGNSSYEIRWFTPLCEVRLCGHATMAAAHVLLTRFQPQIHSIAFLTKFHGTLTVSREANLLCMDFPEMVSQRCSVPEGLSQALELTSAPLEVLEANNTYILVLDSEQEVSNVHPNSMLLEKFHPHAIAVTAPGTNADFVSRYFAPSYGVPEDPVTGSLQCALAPYWAKRIGRSQLHAHQFSERGGELWCEFKKERVLVKGKAVLTMEAALEI